MCFGVFIRGIFLGKKKESDRGNGVNEPQKDYASERSQSQKSTQYIISFI